MTSSGTGITPMDSIIRWILTKRLDMELFLVFANKTDADIIFRDEWELGCKMPVRCTGCISVLTGSTNTK
jgi:ferredoxin-NADP reductase